MAGTGGRGRFCVLHCGTCPRYPCRSGMGSKEFLVENIDLLKRLCETPGVPGREERVRKLIEQEVSGLFDTVETDAMGSLICTRSPRGKKSKARAGSNGKATRVMLL